MDEDDSQNQNIYNYNNGSINELSNNFYGSKDTIQWCESCFNRAAYCFCKESNQYLCQSCCDVKKNGSKEKNNFLLLNDEEQRNRFLDSLDYILKNL